MSERITSFFDLKKNELTNRLEVELPVDETVMDKEHSEVHAGDAYIAHMQTLLGSAGVGNLYFKAPDSSARMA